MRDSITVLAILLILILTAALVAPYFIDWDSHRQFIEAKLTEATGAPVSVAGPIEVRLLPQPTFRLSQVTVGRSTPGQQSLTAARLDAQVSLTALMRGDLQVTEATLQQPKIDLSAAANGSLPIAMPAIADPQRIQIQHVGIVGGSISLADPDGHVTRWSGLDLDGEATSLLGPFKFTGHFGDGPTRTAFRLSTGAYENGRLRLKLGLDGSGARPAIDLDGTIVTSAAAARAGPGRQRAGPRFEGTLLLTGSIALAETPASIPWRLSTGLTADRDKVVFADLDLGAGVDLRGLTATGTGEATFGDRPNISLRLHAPQINADALGVVPENATAVPPSGIELVTRLYKMAQERGSAPTLPVRLDLDYGVDTASAGPQTIFGVAGHLGLDRDSPAEVRFSADGPDGARLSLDGHVEAGTAPLFRGRLEASVRDVARFGDWLSPALPDLAGWVKRTVRARLAAFNGTVDLSAVGGAARDATLTLDRTTLTGTLSYTEAVGSERARLFADLRAGAAALDDLPSLGQPGPDWDALDLDVTFAAASLSLAPRPTASGTDGALATGQVALRLRKSGPKATLDRLSADFGTAKLQATGSLDVNTAQTQVMIDAPDLAPLTDLLAHVAPGQTADLLQARAAVLSPARVNLSLEASRGADGALLPEAASIVGRVNGTDLDAQIKPDRPGDLDPTTAIVSARLLARSPQSLTLLRQLGLPLTSGDVRPVSADPAQVDAQAHGSFAAGFDTNVDAQLGGATLAYSGRAKPGLGSGHLSLKGTDLLPALKSAGIMAASARGALPLQGDADLSWHDSSVALRRLSGRLAGIAFNGDLNTDLAPSTASARAARPVLFGTLSLDRADLATLFGLALGVAEARGAAGNAPAAWSEQPFGTVPLRLPRTEVAIKAGSLALTPEMQARNASFTIRSDANAFTLADLTGTLDGGSLAGSLTLRRDGPTASLAGTVSLSDIGLAMPDVGAKLGGSIDLAGSGTSPATLVASLAGRGSVILGNAEIARADPSAIPRAAHSSEQNTSEVDADQVDALLSAELAHGPLPVGDVAGPASLAAGLLRLGPLHTDGDGWTADTDAAVDLKTLSGTVRTSIMARQPLPDWKGEPAQVGVALRNLPDVPDREIDAIGFINALQSRAIARDQERIDTIQQDIRERAAFNRRLKAIEVDQKAARDQAKADADARNAAELDRLLDQEKLNPFDLPTAKAPSGPVGPAIGGPPAVPPKASRPAPSAAGRSTPASPRPRPLQPRLLPSAPSATQGIQKGPVPADPAIEGRY